MKQIELTSKLVLAIIGLTSVSALLVPSYAAQKITSADIVNETILSEDIKNGEVKNADLGTDAVTSTKIKNGEVGTDDLTSELRAKIDGLQQQLDNLKFETVRVQESVTVAAGSSASVNVQCPDGTEVTGGGYFTLIGGFEIIVDRPEGSVPDASQYQITARNNSPADQEIIAYAECGKIVS
jgi:hypothetical protein